MGCASSTPLVESGKNLVEAAKETATEAVNKSEKAIHDVSETAIDSLNSGVDSVKETMQSAFNSAENNVSNVVGKIGKTFSFSSTDNLKNNLKEPTTNELEKDDFLTNMSDVAGEAVSEAETVLASEAEQMKNTSESMIHSMHDTINDGFNNSIEKEASEVKSKVSDLKEQLDNNMKNQLNEMKNHANELKSQANDFKTSMIETLDDLEDDASKHFDMLGDNVKNMDAKLEEILKTTPTTSPDDLITMKEQMQQKEE